MRFSAAMPCTYACSPLDGMARNYYLLTWIRKSTQFVVSGSILFLPPYAPGEQEKPFWVEFKALLVQGGLDQTTFLSRIPPKQCPSYFHSAAVTKSFAAQIWVGFDPRASRARLGVGRTLSARKKVAAPRPLLIFFQQTRRKLDDVGKKLEILYDKLRDNLVRMTAVPPLEAKWQPSCGWFSWAGTGLGLSFHCQAMA